MSGTWIVMKFGGTSVAGLRQWQTIESLVLDRVDAGHRVCVVCSAVAGMTDALTALSQVRRPAGTRAQSGAVDSIIERHRQLAVELGVDFDMLGAQAAKRLGDLLGDDSIQPGEALRAELLAVGEWLSTRLGAQFLGRSVDVQWADAREALRSVEESASAARRWLGARCDPGPDPDLQQRWSANRVIVTQGFIAAGPDGGTVLLGRGGSDTSAALLAGRLEAERVEIWTDVPGFFSADPRRLPQARQLKRLDYEEALEIAASGAGVVHPRAIRAAMDGRIEMQVLDSARPGLPGTVIDAAREAPGQAGARAVIEQDGMVVLLLQNLDMRQQVGFLAGVFGVFERHGLSVDLVATSETTTTVALNRSANVLETQELASLMQDLVPLCTVRLFDPCSCVNIVGRGVRRALAELPEAMRFFGDHPLLMLSQSANDTCLSMLVEESAGAELLRITHDALIPAGSSGQQGTGTFGPSWRALSGVGS
jgi:diaminopimelate decarboxylase/aspartate kinase